MYMSLSLDSILISRGHKSLWHMVLNWDWLRLFSAAFRSTKWHLHGKLSVKLCSTKKKKKSLLRRYLCWGKCWLWSFGQGLLQLLTFGCFWSIYGLESWSELMGISWAFSLPSLSSQVNFDLKDFLGRFALRNPVKSWRRNSMLLLSFPPLETTL